MSEEEESGEVYECVHPNFRSTSTLAFEEFKFKSGEDGVLRAQISTPDTLS
jgi:hypothetical protein